MYNTMYFKMEIQVRARPTCESGEHCVKCEIVKNITVSLPDDVYRQARIRAAERDTSVSAMVREFLLNLGEEESDFERRRRLQTEVLDTVKGFRAGVRLTRKKLHERDALR